MSKYICLLCKFIGDFYEFVHDWFWSEKDDDEIASLRCPKCGNDDEDTIIEND